MNGFQPYWFGIGAYLAIFSALYGLSDFDEVVKVPDLLFVIGVLLIVLSLVKA